VTLSTAHQALFDEGAACFDRGAWWDAHERWERVWIDLAPPERVWVQGLIQAAASLVKRAQAADEPAARLAERARAKLADAPPVLFGVVVATVLAKLPLQG
jgi:predicted metal-dependent hydrolase